MSSLVFSKLDYAISQLSVIKTSKYSDIAYIKYRSFYDLLSHFSNVELDHKISALLSLVIEVYKKRRISLFSTP